MKITRILSFITLAATLFVSAIPASAQNVRVRESFDADWLFTRGDPDEASTNLTYTAALPWLLPMQNPFTTKAPVAPPPGNFGDHVPYTQPGFDDSDWRKLNLPHDFGIEGPFQQALPGETAKLPWFGVAWYRKHFDVPVDDAGRQLYLDVDGAMAYSTVWINGHCVGGWPYGYASWRVDLTPYVNFGGANTLAIRLRNPNNSSRWYPGGGIYRNVWLTKTSPVHVSQWGTHITTPRVGKDAATVSVQTSVDNDSATEASVKITTAIFELKADGAKAKKSIAVITTEGVKIAGGATADAAQTVIIPNPKLWGVVHPNRYVAVTTITQGDKMVDVYETPFGVRTIQFTADNGFLLNGERVRLNGVCDHADLGALGTAINPRALQRQLEILRGMGCDAIRTSHNPPAPELLDLCDRLGFLVMDEALDAWTVHKKSADYVRIFNTWHEADVRAYVRRDRNHPCVILWSIGNEIPEEARPNTFPIAQDLAAAVRREDATRPITAACDHIDAGYNGFQHIVDVFGYNYKPAEYGKFRAANPTIPLFGSETASTVSSRGEYFFPVGDMAQAMTDFQMSSYDFYAGPWATTPEAEFKGQDENPFVAGEFVWTGFDYLGEPTPYNSDFTSLNNYSNPADRARAEKQLAQTGKIHTQSRSSYYGIVDLAGFPKDRYYLYQARWRPDFPMAHILPHWNWPGREGKITPVQVYTSGDEAELFLNGQSLGRKQKGQFEYRLRWDEVKYEPGELKIVAYKNGRPWATGVMQTTGPAAKLTLAADRAKIAADGKDLSYVTVTVADQKGRLVPRSKNHLEFDIDGPGEIVAVDNGDPTSFEPFQAEERDAFNGLALVIVRATQPGTITLTAHADGLKDATARITGQP
jgi:beta-galactosidase